MKKHCVAKILKGIWERFLYENRRNYNSYKFSYKFTLIPFLSCHRNQKQKSNFQQVGGLVTSNSFAFCFRVALYLKGMPNSIDFYKRIFLHFIPVRIIVPWFYRALVWYWQTWKVEYFALKIEKFQETRLQESFFLIGLYASIRLFSRQYFNKIFSKKFQSHFFNSLSLNTSRTYGKKPNDNFVRVFC